MKCALIVALALFAVVYSVEQYSSEHDKHDLDAIINDPVQLNAYVGCLIKNSGCTDITNFVKQHLPEAFEQGCAKCTDEQKQLLKKLLEGLKDKLPEAFEALKRKYDPQNKYYAALETALA